MATIVLVTELGAPGAVQWLERRGLASQGAAITELGGGVSNVVLLVELPGFRAVLKQSLGRLRVNEEWLSDQGRILREASAMRWLSGRVRGGHVPALLREDPEDFTILMEAAPSSARMWKSALFDGDIQPATARQAALLLASVISESWDNPEARRIFGDQTVFDELRIDPYYRFTAARHPALAPQFHSLIARSAARAASLVHGDFSPKNLLVADDELWAIDWEVVHFGDPSFDAAFLLNHLLLKSIAIPRKADALGTLAQEFSRTLTAHLPATAHWIPAAALEHLPALLLARVDGKSPAEYLDVPMRDRARSLAVSLFRDPPASVEEAFTR